MPNFLFMKVPRMHGQRRAIAWDMAEVRAYSASPGGFRMTGAEVGEFAYLLERSKASAVGAGGQFEYRVYERIGEARVPLTIVRPTIPAVREQFPNACRLVNIQTGEESALFDTPDHAEDHIRVASSGKAKGSFGA